VAAESMGEQALVATDLIMAMSEAIRRVRQQSNGKDGADLGLEI
jgi:hypothetical protein